jgi:hypothetical protein
VETTLGAPVETAIEQSGGMSPGCATRLACADGTRAFVKAVGVELNPLTPNLFRREILALGLLGSHPLWPSLLATYDDGDWVALLLEDVVGVHPDLGDDAVMARLLDSTDQLGTVLQQRVPVPPEPDPAHGGLTDTRLAYRAWLDALDHVGDVPRDLSPPWVVHRAPEFQERLVRLSQEPMSQLVHWDIRDDNLLQRPDGRLVFLDWGSAGVGPDWLDPLLARLERVEQPWFDVSVATAPALERAGDATVTTWLVGIGAFLAWRAHTAVDVNLPTLNEFRRRESARFLAGAARRLGI